MNPVMLGKNWKPGMPIRGWVMSEKLDGVRGIWDGIRMLSRADNEFAVPDWFLNTLPPFALDGELWAGRGEFQYATSIVRKKEPQPEWTDIVYMVFDSPEIKGKFIDRLTEIKLWFAQHPTRFVNVVTHSVCKGEEHLMEELAKVEKLGGEGLMIRDPNAPYIDGRTDLLLKVKSQQEGRGLIIEHQYGEGRNEFRVGSLLVENEKGVRFSVGIGLSDEDRENPPQVGTFITFRYQGLTKLGVPRFPRLARSDKTLDKGVSMSTLENTTQRFVAISN